MVQSGLEVLCQVFPYLSCYPENCYNISICPIFRPRIIGRHFSTCNEIGTHNMMLQYGIPLEKYRVTKSGYFRLASTVVFGMGITYVISYYVMTFQIKSRTSKFQ